MTSPEALLAHAAWVERLAQRLVRDDAQAADVVQETWLQALRKPPAGGPTRAWLGTVLRNTARRSGRKEQDRLHAEREGARAETQPDVQAVISRAALSQEVVGDVLALEEPYRSVVLLRWFEDLGPSEIARKLDRPVSTVKTQLQRGHEHLRQRLAERHGDECWGLALLPLLHPRRSVPLTTIVAVLAIAILAALAAWRPWQASSPDGVTTSLAGVGIADQPLRPAAGSTRASSALRIVDPAGRPISALPIRLVSPRSAEISPTLLSVGNNEPKVLETETDAQGVPVLTEGDTFTDDDLLGCTIEPNTPGWMLIGDGLLPEAAEQSRERRCVIARTTEVTGIVRGMDGTGLPRARLSVQVRRDALPRLPYRLDPQPGGALGQTWESWTMAGDDGRYAFEVPAGPDFLILAHADGHTGLLQPAPGAGKHTPTLDFDLLPRTDEGRWVAGFVLDEDSGPVAGAQNIIPGLEVRLEGKSAGDKVEAVIPPDEAYGVHNEQLIMDVPRTELPEGELTVGMQFQVQHEGGIGVVTLTKLGLEKVTLDGNHPLAGETLHFDVEVVEVREATAEELEHGHVHGPGGHHH